MIFYDYHKTFSINKLIKFIHYPANTNLYFMQFLSIIEKSRYWSNYTKTTFRIDLTNLIVWLTHILLSATNAVNVNPVQAIFQYW